MGAIHRKKLLEQVGDYSRSLKDLNTEIEDIVRSLSSDAPEKLAVASAEKVRRQRPPKRHGTP
jgi:hypothetical protein